MNEYFADTYAYIEIITRNPSYDTYADAQLRTTKINLAELIYWYIRTGKEQHKEAFGRLWDECVSLKLSTIYAAMKFKHAHREEKLSYADCIGYVTAAELGIPFLTGDEQFAEKKNVEYVK